MGKSCGGSVLSMFKKNSEEVSLFGQNRERGWYRMVMCVMGAHKGYVYISIPSVDYCWMIITSFPLVLLGSL